MENGENGDQGLAVRAVFAHPPSFVEVGLTIAGALLAVVLLLYLLPPPG